MNDNPIRPSFDWGTFEKLTRKKQLAPFDNGRVLFVLRGDDLTFPTRKWRPLPFVHIDAVGYLNTQPIRLEVELPYLTSRDNIACSSLLSLEIFVKSDIGSKRSAILQNEQLHGSLCLTVEASARQCFKVFDYERMFLDDADFISSMNAVVDEALSAKTPYTLRQLLVDSIASHAEGVDEAIRRAAESKVEADKSSDALEKRRVADEARRQQEIEDLTHVLDLEKKKAASELERRKKEEDQLRKIKQAELDSRIRSTRKLAELIGEDDKKWLALHHPNLYAKIHVWESRQYIATSRERQEMAIAVQQLMQEHARDTGVMETLQNVMDKLKLQFHDHKLAVHTGADGDGLFEDSENFDEDSGNEKNDTI